MTTLFAAIARGSQIGLFGRAGYAVAALVAANALLPASAAAADFPRYTAERIDVPRAFKPTAINRRDDLAGYKQIGDPSVSGSLAFRRTAGVVDVLNDWEGGARYSQLTDLNEEGLAVGFGSREAYSDNDISASGLRALVVTPEGEIVDLGAAMPEHYASDARAVNDAGQVIGNVYQSYRDGFNWEQRSMPFVWSAAAGFSFPFAPGDDDFMEFIDINEAGHVAGIWHRRGSREPVIWDRERGVLQSHYTLGSYDGHVNAINNRDQVAGRDFNKKAFVWSPPEGKTTLPRPYFWGRRAWNCDAKDINDAGVAVGHCRGIEDLDAGYENPLVWVPEGDGYAVGQLFDLVVPPRDFPRQRGGAIALRIDNAGRILVQTYLMRDKSGPAYLLTPTAASRALRE